LPSITIAVTGGSFHVATVAELSSLSWVMADRTKAFEGIQRLAVEVVDDLLAHGERPP
jgi:hypothetical protein